MAEGLTKKQLKELRKLEKMQSKNIEQKSNAVKWVAISVVSALFLVLFVGTILIAKNKDNVKSEKAASFAPSRHERTNPIKEGEATDSATQSQEVTLVEYADIQCPACKTYHPMVNQLLAEYPGKLKVDFRHFPLTAAHPNAMEAAIAVEAAGKQDKFFELLDVLYDKQNEWANLPDPQEKFEEYASALKLDMEKFRRDQKDPAVTKNIDADRNEGVSNGVTGTPSFFLNGKRIENPRGLDEFKKLVDEQLKRSTSSSASGPTTEPQPTLSESQALPLQQ